MPLLSPILKSSILAAGLAGLLDQLAGQVRIAPGMGQRVDGVVCIPGPLYHNAPFSFGAGSLFHGNHLVLLPQIDAEATIAAVKAAKESPFNPAGKRFSNTG